MSSVFGASEQPRCRGAEGCAESCPAYPPATQQPREGARCLQRYLSRPIAPMTTTDALNGCSRVTATSTITTRAYPLASATSPVRQALASTTTKTAGAGEGRRRRGRRLAGATIKLGVHRHRTDLRAAASGSLRLCRQRQFNWCCWKQPARHIASVAEVRGQPA
ncbi:hypothetical protein ACU4GD_10240 [Cupriavidus basilensis]